MILEYSRIHYFEFTTNISTENVIIMHLSAFSFYEGFTDTILYDNTKQIVIERKLKVSVSRFNPKFIDFGEYYGIVIRLCYPYRQETKGKIENTIKYLRYNFFNGSTFDDLNHINVQCTEWLNSVNSQIHGATHEMPLQRLKDEKPNSISAVPV